MTNDSVAQFSIFFVFFVSLLTFGLAITKRREVQRKSQLMGKLFGELEFQIPEEEWESTERRRSNLLPKIIGNKYRSRLQNRLSKSGQLGDDHLNKIITKKFLYAFVALILGIIYFYKSGGYLNAFFVGILGFLLPDLLLTNTIQKRSEAIQDALPDSVEMLTMCVEAGLTFQQALGRVSENQNTVISTEFARVMSEIQIGESRSAALSSMAQRLDHPDVKKFVSAMQQVDRLGIPISAVLIEQVKELRGKSRDRAKEKAQKVPVKILGPLITCFLPSILIIVIGPVVIQAISAFK